MLILAATTGKCYSVNESTWALTEIFDLTSGQIVDMADFGGYFLATNGTKMAEPDGVGGYNAFTSKTDIPRFSTVCAFKGQAIGGNVKTDWYNCGTISLVWSEVGKIKFTPTKLNTAGFRNIPWPGNVLRVKRLGDVVMVYGDRGVGALFPVSAPAPTFGLKEVLNIGIAAKGAIGGDEHVHVFVDEEGWLWKIEEGQAPKRLGYQEFFSPMTAANLMVSLDPGEQEFYISDGTTGYLLTRWGLCETYQSITSVARVGSAVIAPFSSGSDTSFTLTMDTVDFGIRGLKTLSGVELGVDTGEVDQNVTVSTYWRSGIKDAFGQTDYVMVDPMTGVVAPVITANEFRVSVKAAAYGGMKLDHIKMRYKLVDKRGIRGLYSRA